MKNKKEWKPILFSSDMVQTILDGRKTVTRRLQGLPAYFNIMQDGTFCVNHMKKDRCELVSPLYFDSEGFAEEFCPYFEGQKLWVKETYSTLFQEGYIKSGLVIIYKASSIKDYKCKWKPSLFMRREYSRIDLLVKEVDIGFLGDMDHESFLMEGFEGKDQFIKLWNEKNPKNKFKDEQPCWEINFEVLEVR